MNNATISRWAACAATLLLIAGAEARAGFSYSSSSNPASVTFGGSTIGLGTVTSASTLSTPTLVNLLNISDTTTTTPPGTDSTSIAFTDTVAITNIPPPGTTAAGSLTFSGILSFTRSDTGGEVSTFTLTSVSGPTSIDGVTYTLSNLVYAAPTVNSTTGVGNISGLITSTATVPEPASIAMIGIGLATAMGFAARRRAGAATA